MFGLERGKGADKKKRQWHRKKAKIKQRFFFPKEGVEEENGFEDLTAKDRNRKAF